MTVQSDTLLKVDGLEKHFDIRDAGGRLLGTVRAVNGISFTLRRGETYGIVGESGSGKTTAGKMLVNLVSPSAGSVEFEGHDLLSGDADELRHQIQMVFQDPYASLNPRKKVGQILIEALAIRHIGTRATRRDLALDALRRVGFGEEHLDRFPHQFSGGQRQRIGIARALCVSPSVIVCDEAVSALDVSIQAQVLNMLLEIQRELGISYVFISHDLSVVQHVSDQVGVMYLGEMVEQGPVDEVFRSPAHPYTKSLLSAVPVADPRHPRQRVALSGEVPSPLDLPSGCPFHTRCPVAIPLCAEKHPTPVSVSPTHTASCHLAVPAAGTPAPQTSPTPQPEETQP